MIRATELVKRFAADGEIVTAVDHVSFEARAGEVFGLLGPNGAGKTTTLRMLVTLLTPDEGTATVCGYDVRTHAAEVRRSIGYLSTSTGLYGRLTARELLTYFAQLQNVDDPTGRVDALMTRFEITPYANKRCDRLSTGMKQKVSIARALIHDPAVLILDEPTAGLDVIVAQTFLEFIEEARDDGKCVLFSTHVMSEAERLCSRIAIIHGGRILDIGTLDQLRERTGEHYLEQIFIKSVERAGT